MTTKTFAVRLARFAPICLIALAFAGCQSKPAATVQIRALDESREMTQKFSNAYYSPGDGGAYDIVLVERAMPADQHRRGLGDSIAPSDGVPLTHVLHVRVLWRPKKMVRPDSPTATNASVHWSVIGDNNAARVDYDGIGFANVYGDGEEVSVRLAEISIKPVSATGGLGDPIGASKLSASFKATRDSRMVRALVDKTRQPFAAAPTDAISPPVRTPGP